MEVQEISSRLDYALQKAKGGLILDEYTKSIYLTKAQVMFVESVLARYEYGDSLRHVLGRMLVPVEDTTVVATDGDKYSFDSPLDVKSIVYEIANDTIPVIPLDHNDEHEVTASPFRKPYPDLAYRITGNKIFTIFSSETITKFYYIYCKEPKAIVLETLPSGLKIRTIGTATASELPYDSVLKVIDMAVLEILKDRARLAPAQEQEKTN